MATLAPEDYCKLQTTFQKFKDVKEHGIPEVEETLTEVFGSGKEREGKKEAKVWMTYWKKLQDWIEEREADKEPEVRVL
jgi:hypothetical protein